MPLRSGVVALLVLAALPAGAAAQARPALERVDSCQDLAGFARAAVLRTGGGTGVPFRGDVVAPAVLRPAAIIPPPGSERLAGAPQPATAEGADGQAGTDLSTTNAQEAGVDEPDIVKTDGRRLYV